MDYRLLIKVISVISLVIIVANLLLVSFQVYSWIVFWGIIILVALVAFPGMNWLQKKAVLQKQSKKGRK